MGLFEKIFKYRQDLKQAGAVFRTLTGYQPAFTSWNGKIYESLLVRSAIHARATHISKLQVTVPGSSRLARQLSQKPNPWQSWPQLLYRVSTILDVHNTAILAPIFDAFGQVTGIYPVLPSEAQLRELDGVVYLRFRFSNGKASAVEFHRCGILTKFQYRDDFFGESNDALNPTMELVHLQDQGIAEAVKSSATFRFMARMTNWKDPDDLAKERRLFTKNNLQNDSGGLLLFPNTYDTIQQIKTAPYVVSAEQMTAIKENVHSYFGTNDEILQNKAYGDAWNAFYEGVPEWFGIQLAEALSPMLFTPAQLLRGVQVAVTANRMQYMSNKDKMLATQTFADRGLAMVDEIRQIWNMPPLPDGQGQRIPIRGEYYDLRQGKQVSEPGTVKQEEENK